MFAIFPIVGGALLARFASRAVAIAVTVVLWAAAVAVLVATAPQHGSDASAGTAVVAGLIVGALAAGSFALGLWWRARSSRADIQVATSGQR